MEGKRAPDFFGRRIKQKGNKIFGREGVSEVEEEEEKGHRPSINSVASSVKGETTAFPGGKKNHQQEAHNRESKREGGEVAVFILGLSENRGKRATESKPKRNLGEERGPLLEERVSGAIKSTLRIKKTIFEGVSLTPFLGKRFSVSSGKRRSPEVEEKKGLKLKEEAYRETGSCS